MTLLEFITARLDEDETRAREQVRRNALFSAPESPAFTLRRCRVFRAMLRHAEDAAKYDRTVADEWGVSDSRRDHVTDPVIDVLMHRDIAAYWCKHRDYQPEWKPEEQPVKEPRGTDGR